MRILKILFLAMTMSWLVTAVNAQDSEGKEKIPSDRELTVSLVTCYPGPEIYELCGHEAIRVRGEGIDSVWNFGIFNFDQPNFIYRFVKGETDYKCVGYPFSWFLPEYEERGSKVVEQDLNLTSAEALRVLELLRESAKPENAVYRYNYVKDNCATRILDRVEDAADGKIHLPDSVRCGTFRNEMREFHKGYPWYQFGIDLALGSGLDYPIGSREEMFVPMVMERNLDASTFSDGRPVVKEKRTLYEGHDAILPPTPWYAGPFFWSCAVSVFAGCLLFFNLRKKKITRTLYAVWFSALGLAGCLVSFLVFISVHEASSPNALILWLNPLQFLFVVGVLSRRLKPLAIGMAYYNIIVTGCLLIVWPFIRQSGNPSFFPLMIATVTLGIVYAIIGFKTSYKKRR